MVFKAFPIPSLVIVCHFGFFDRIVVDSGPCLPCPSAKLTFVILLRKASLFIKSFLFEYVPGLLRATSGLLISSTKCERRHIRHSQATLKTSHARFVRRFCCCAMDSGTSPTTLILSLAYLAAMIGTFRVQDPGGSLNCEFLGGVALSKC